MELMIVLGVGTTIGIVRIFISKRGGNSGKKLRYYNYSKYTVKHKKLNQSLNEQSKTTF